MKDKPVVVVVDSIYHKAKAVFDAITDFQIKVASAEENSLAVVLAREDAFCVVLDAKQYKGPLYEHLPQGGLIARFGVGYDGVDLEKAARCGLRVTNTPGVLESTVAESTLFLAGEVLRTFGRADQRIRQGHWEPYLGHDLGGKTWVILGLGQIGRRLSAILSFGYGVKVYGLKTDLTDAGNLARQCGAERIASEFLDIAPYGDIVSVHLPANQTTRHYLNATRLAQLKTGAVLINTGRGSLVDEIALYDAISGGKLAGAGLDVFEQEPYLPAAPNKDLRDLSAVVMTPHVSSSTEECAVRMAQCVLKNIRFAQEGRYDQMDLVRG